MGERQLEVEVREVERRPGDVPGLVEDVGAHRPDRAVRDAGRLVDERDAEAVQGVDRPCGQPRHHNVGPEQTAAPPGRLPDAVTFVIGFGDSCPIRGGLQRFIGEIL